MNIRTNKFVLLYVTLIIKFAIAGCFHSKCRSVDESNSLLAEHSKDKIIDIKLNCMYYTPGNFYSDGKGFNINFPSDANVENMSNNLFEYSGTPVNLITKGKKYILKSCRNIENKRIIKGKTLYLYFSAYYVSKKEIIEGKISISLTNDGNYVYEFRWSNGDIIILS